MYDYDYYYEQGPSEIDQMIEEAVDKVKRTILLRAKDEVEQQTLRAEKIEEEYQNFKDGTRKIIDDKKAKIKDLEERLKTLQEAYDKKRTEIPTFEHEIGEKVWMPHAELSKELTCPTCQGTGRVILCDDKFGNIEINCPHCQGSEWKRKGNFVKKASYWEYKPMEATIDSIYINLNEDHELHIKYNVRPQCGSIISNLECEVFDFQDKQGCLKRCEELSQKSLEDAKQYIYNGEKR